MPVDEGPYCVHCVDQHGHLQAYDERLRRLTAFLQARDPTLDRAAAERQARAHMRTMPAWRGRPELAG
jgi:hypothetical protein